MCILDIHIRTTDDILEILRVQNSRICLKINVKKAVPLKLGISECKNVLLGNEKIDQVDSFPY